VAVGVSAGEAVGACVSVGDEVGVAGRRVAVGKIIGVPVGFLVGPVGFPVGPAVHVIGTFLVPVGETLVAVGAGRLVLVVVGDGVAVGVRVADADGGAVAVITITAGVRVADADGGAVAVITITAGVPVPDGASRISPGMPAANVSLGNDREESKTKPAAANRSKTIPATKSARGCIHLASSL